MPDKKKIEIVAPVDKLLTIEDVEKAINEVYLLVDPGIIRIILATVVANRLKLSDKPVWLLILAGSSSGKSALLDIINECGPWIVPIDSLTTNTFASGLKRDEETSLLHKANDGILVFKDFTTLTSMNEEGLREIMGQLRGIYDGSFNKKTGNNVEVNWKGKIGVIAGGTGAAAQKMRQFSEQGERFINYRINVADSEEMAIRAMENVIDGKEKEARLREIVGRFMNERLDSEDDDGAFISDKLKLKMIRIADFATMARSPVTMDKKNPNMVIFVGDREQPSRFAIQLANMAIGLNIISQDDELSPLNAQILYKTALDSIPVERRMVLSILAEYREASTKSIAHKLHYSTSVVKGWCNQLDSLKMIKRVSNGTTDIWTLDEEYKTIMCEYENINSKDVELEISGVGVDGDGEGNAYVPSYQIDDDDELDEEEIQQFNFDNFDKKDVPVPQMQKEVQPSIHTETTKN